jgi:quercetin dioxygenase-like cupin family protein
VRVDVRPFPRPDWDQLPGEGVVGVTGRVLVRDETFFVAQLRFAENATIHPHAGERDTIVACIEGEGFTAVGKETASLGEGQQVRWPRRVVHGLWTEGSTMTTLMIEHFD